MKSSSVGSVVFVAAIVFLAFIGGALAMLADVFPAEILKHAYVGGKALVAKQTEYNDRLKTDLWAPARSDAQGVTVCENEETFGGFTLYTSGDGPYARLIDMDGRVAHEWRRPFSEVWDETAAIKHPRSDDLIYMDMARVLPNGDLLAIYTAAGDTPWGYGLVKLDRESRVIWRFLDHTHHDFDVAPDGRIFVLTHAFTDEALESFRRLERPRLADYLVVLSPDGQEEKRVSLTHALAQSRFNGFLHAIPVFALADPLHTNSVEVITAENARNFGPGEAGQVVLSFRDSGTVAVLDVEREEIVWAARGSWLGQHDPSVLENGNILLFDNLGAHRPGNAARVLEVDPETLGIVWRYEGTPEDPLHSAIRSSSQRLPNGNTLIDESDGGRLLEVTPIGKKVWEFVNPVRAGEGDQLLPVVSSGRRVDPLELDAQFRNRLAGFSTECGAAQAAMLVP